MDAITMQEIATAIHGTLFHEKPGKIQDISIDNREIVPGCIFFAIRGEHFDGHDFVHSAYDNGAVCTVVEREIATLEPYILVEDTRRALLDLGRDARRRFAGTVVGVTGSVGKTTTKEMLHSILSKKFETLKTQGNLNNAIGLPRTLCNLDKNYQAAVIEMGMSARGEISALSQTAIPNIGVITTIGSSHIQQLKTRENILRAKLEILDGMPPDAPLIVNADNYYLANLSSGMYVQPIKENRIIRCGIQNKNAEYRAENIRSDEQSTYFDLVHNQTVTHIHLPTLGEHHVMNAMLAFAAGERAGVSAQQAAIALEEYRTVGMRQNVRFANGMTIVADCYNAGPESMRAALHTLSQIHCEGRRVAVLGDMLELGEFSPQMHQEIGETAAKENINALFCYGSYAKWILKGADSVPRKEWYAEKEEMQRDLKRYLKPGDVILFKASRGMRLETVIESLFPQLSIGNF